MVKGCVVQIDATPFRQWYEQHYAESLGKKKQREEESSSAAVAEEKKESSDRVARKIQSRKKDAAVEPTLADQFVTGRLYAVISSRPGQCGRADGYVLEGKELEFYLKKIKSKK